MSPCASVVHFRQVFFVVGKEVADMLRLCLLIITKHPDCFRVHHLNRAVFIGDYHAVGAVFKHVQKAIFAFIE